MRYEMLLMAELGYALDLSACTVTGALDDRAFVSPKSSAAVSRISGTPYADRLLPLPPFLAKGEADASWADILEDFRLTGHFLTRDILVDRHADSLVARLRFIERIRRLSQ